MSGRNPITQFFPITPEYMSWEDWNGNLAIYYSQEHIMFKPEEDWKDVARHMASLAKFGPFPIDSPDQYDNWQDWANHFSLIVNRTNA